MAGIWIRSQEKRLLVNVIGVISVANKIEGILPSGFNNSSVCLGEYETCEKALQVLDEIHGRINNLHVDTLSCMFFDGSFNLPQLEPAVYQMPAE